MNARQNSWFSRIFRATKSLVAMGLLATGVQAYAQEVVVGITSGVTGPVAANVKELLSGAQLVINETNAQGGIKGRKIRVELLDDAFDPKKAGENARILIEEKKADVLFLVRGTPHTQAVLPLLAQHNIALLAPSTGAMLLHQPVNPNVFNVRTTYQAESRAIVRHFSTIGVTSIAVVHVDDSFGQDGMVGANAGFESVKLKPVSVTKFDRAKPDVAAVAEQLKKANPQAVLIIGSGSAVADIVKKSREIGVLSQFATLSNNASSGFIKLLGGNAAGMIVSQVFPDERSGSTTLAKRFARSAKAAGMKEVSPAAMEGYAAALVLVEGLRKSKALTRTGIRDGIESISGFNLGGPVINFSATDHTGMDLVEVSIVARDGRFMR